MKPFETWTVTPHKPIEKLESNLWRVEGDIPGQRGTRVMTVIIATGGLVIHNAIALDDAQMKDLEAFGDPEVLIVPNGFHRLDAKIYKQRYPKLRVLAPSAAVKKVSQVVAVDGTMNEGPDDPRVTMRDAPGTNGHEGVIEVKTDSGTTLVVNDMINNLPKLGGMVGFMLAPTGRPSVPRVFRWFFVKDKPAFITELDRLSKLPELTRVIVSHGDMLTNGDQLRTALTAF